MKRISWICLLLIFCHGWSAVAAEKEWTFLIYINGNNNLDPYGAMNINAMENVPSSPDVNVVVQWASYRRETALRLLVQPDSNPEYVTSPVLADLGRVDMGDHRTLSDFLKWGHDQFPAKKYFVVVWNHGTGWNRRSVESLRDISLDDFTDNLITTEQLGQVMHDFSEYSGKKVEVYASDACLMASIEVADEMSESVKYFGGSQHLEPAYGWPYEQFLKQMIANPSMDGGQALQILAKEYLAAYSDGVYGEEAVTFSAYDLSFFPALKDSIRALAQSLNQSWSMSSSKILDAALDSEWFFRKQNRDLVHFVKNLKKSETTVSSAVLDSVLESSKKFIIANEASADYPGAHGITIWMPQRAYEFVVDKERYKKLKFNQNTDWSSFLYSVWN